MADYCDIDCHVRNVSHGGLCLITYGCGYKKRLVDIFDKELIQRRPQMIVVGIGRNDLCHATNAQMRSGLRQLKAKAARAEIPILFNTIAPHGEKYGHWPCEEQRLELNAWMREKLPVNDLARLLIDPRTSMLNSRYDCGDGLHLNTAAHRMIGTFLYRYMVDRLDLPHVAVAAPNPPRTP
jgi:lysophospholipase L1-like esterase